jgi:NADH-quinone oxidoreductase subunit N
MLLAVLKDATMLWLVVIAILCATVSVYYYFRVIQAMYFKEVTSEQDQQQLPEFSRSFKLIILFNSLLIIALGIHPDWLTNLL